MIIFVRQRIRTRSWILQLIKNNKSNKILFYFVETWNERAKKIEIIFTLKIDLFFKPAPNIFQNKNIRIFNEETNRAI